MRRLQILLLILGSLLLLGTAMIVWEGSIWGFTYTNQHRFTSMAMLTGTLRLHGGISRITSDEQIFNGAGYTNWGYGVPLLEMPFHAIARRASGFPTGFFPDRAIFFFYLATLVPVLWLTIDRLIAGRYPDPRWIRRGACSFAATCLVLTTTIYPLMAYRFLIYEQTIAYLTIAELFAMCAYLHALRSDRLTPIVALGLAAGFGLLIRVTGLGYLGVWGVLVLLGRRPRARLAVFVGAIAPFVAFWLYSNAVKSGSPFSTGYANSVPYYGYHFPIQRFGSQCADTLEHTLEVWWELFRAFFFHAEADPSEPHLKACHFTMELQDPWHSPHSSDGLFGLTVPLLLLAILARYVVRYVTLGERRLAVYVPFAALLALLASYFHAAIGFVWRYAYDFWPLMLLVLAQAVAGAVPSVRRHLFGWPAAVAFAVLCGVGFRRNVLPQRILVATVRPGTEEDLDMAETFRLARWGEERPYPTRLGCHDTFAWTHGGVVGWRDRCRVDTFTNVYLGVPRKSGRHYELRLETEGFEDPSVRVFVNGKFYTAQRQSPDGVYVADVDIDYAALTTPTVMAAVQWTRGFTPVLGSKLLAIELV
jgi:hypothetical protein